MISSSRFQYLTTAVLLCELYRFFVCLIIFFFFVYQDSSVIDMFDATRGTKDLKSVV